MCCLDLWWSVGIGDWALMTSCSSRTKSDAGTGDVEEGKGETNSPGKRRVPPNTKSAGEQPESSRAVVLMPRRTRGRWAIQLGPAARAIKRSFTAVWNRSIIPLD